MKEVNFEEIKENNLRLIEKISSGDFSKIILLMERYKENPLIKYYLMDFIFYNENTEEGYFKVSFWGD